MLHYRLRTLLIVLALGPPVIAGCYFSLRQLSAPIWAVALGSVQVVIWIVVLFLVIRGAVFRKSSASPVNRR